MRTVVTDEDLVLVVGDHSVGKLQMTRATELVQHCAIAIKHDHTHHLTAGTHKRAPVSCCEVTISASFSRTKEKQLTFDILSKIH